MLIGDEVLARDGRIGLVEDVCFDGERWAVRYFVVDPGRWLPGGRVLIPPDNVQSELSSGGKLRVALTLQKVSPAPAPTSLGLRYCSAAELVGYDVRARDGPVGVVQDLVLDDHSWGVRGILVDTPKWWPGGLVVVHPDHVEHIDRQARALHLALSREEVQS